MPTPALPNRLAALALLLPLGCSEPDLVVGGISETTGQAGSTTAPDTTSGPGGVGSSSEPTGEPPGSSGTTEPGSTGSSDGGPTSSDGGTSTGPAGTTGSGEASACAEQGPGLDIDPDAIECDVWAQDCGDGQKCVAWADGLQGGAFNATHCVALIEASAAVGESCQYVGDPAYGADDCEFGAICLPTADATGTRCVPQCTGSEGDPQCPDGHACAIANEGVVAFCLPLCDPLGEDCPPAQGCRSIDDTFSCFPDTTPEPGGIGYQTPCEYENECDHGLVCLHAGLVPGCTGERCCAPLCDLDDPMCPDPDLGQECQPWFDGTAAPPGLERVGKCVTACQGDL